MNCAADAPRPAPGAGRHPRGAAMVVVAAALVTILAMLALAIDVGMLFTARAEAQRAADAAALAGASAFLDHLAPEAGPEARARSLAYATRHRVRGADIEPGEVTVQVVPDRSMVRVGIRRTPIGTWFARLLGIESAAVSAVAAAAARSATAARCLKPFALPDLWYNADDDDQLWEQDEEWSFDADRGDYYKQLDAERPLGTAETGYGSGFRNGVANSTGNTYADDWGRPAFLKITNPKKTTESSVFLPWVLPEDEEMDQTCGYSGGGGPGAASYRANICNCNDADVQLGTEYEIQTGNMVGPTHQGVQSLIDQDPDAYWDEAGDSVAGSQYDTWRNSPRLIKIAMYDPALIEKPGKQTIEFNNFGLFFIERQDSPKRPVEGRFLMYVQGSQLDGPTQGPLVKVLRLIE